MENKETINSKSASGEQILSDVEVRAKVKLSRTHIWRLEKEGKFPKRRYLSRYRVGWLVSEIEEWLRNLPTVAIT